MKEIIKELIKFLFSLLFIPMTEEEKYEKQKEKSGQDDAWDYGDEYAFGEDIKFTIPKITHDIRPHSNQARLKETVNACTIVWAVNQLIRLFWIEMDRVESNKFCAEIVNYCTKYWYIIGYGWSTPDAVNTVRKWWNEIGSERYGKEKVFTVRLDYTDKRVWEALDKWHLVGFTYALKFWEDRKKGRVYKESYPGAVGHRCNREGAQYTRPTGGAENKGAEIWVYDNYYERTNEYYIKSLKPYMGHGMYTPAYLFMPLSAMNNTTPEDEIQRIAQLKAKNSLVGALSSTWNDLPDELKTDASLLANKIRNSDKEVRPQIKEEDKKVYQSVVDTLSYAWKYAWEEEQKMYAQLAKHLRETYNLK